MVGGKAGSNARRAVVWESTDAVKTKFAMTTSSAISVQITHRDKRWTIARREVLNSGKAGVAPPGAVVLSSTETLLKLKFATARSSLPSHSNRPPLLIKGRRP